MITYRTLFKKFRFLRVSGDIPICSLDLRNISTFKKMKPSNESSICDHLLECGNNPYFDEFSILAHKNKNFLLEIKESL